MHREVLICCGIFSSSVHNLCDLWIFQLNPHPNGIGNFLIFWLCKMCDLGVIIVLAVVEFGVVVFIFDLVATVLRCVHFHSTVAANEYTKAVCGSRFSTHSWFRCFLCIVCISSSIRLHYKINGNCWYALLSLKHVKWICDILCKTRRIVVNIHK